MHGLIFVDLKKAFYTVDHAIVVGNFHAGPGWSSIICKKQVDPDPLLIGWLLRTLTCGLTACPCAIFLTCPGQVTNKFVSWVTFQYDGALVGEGVPISYPVAWCAWISAANN